MSILIGNEVDRLFSLAFGEQWITAGLLARTSEELKQVDLLASDNVDSALHQIAAIGNILGSGKRDEVDAAQLGWAVASLAEFANITNFIAQTAQSLQDPEMRAFSQATMDKAG